jgi:hypothetical protein
MFSIRTLPALAIGFLPVLAASDTGFLEQLEGYYSAPTKLCSTLEEDHLAPCDPPDTDCMLIDKVDDRHAKVYVYSVQTNGSQCELEGVAELHGKTLRYIEHDKNLPSFGEGLDITVTDGKITFKYLSDKEAARHAFCGMRGSLDWVEFPLQSRAPLGACGEKQTP